jgi:hypothetical protein
MKDKIQQAICFLLYIIAVYLWVSHKFWYLFAGLLSLHFIELLVKGWPVGKRAGKPAFVTIVMTLICGFTWWLPLEKGLHYPKGEVKE